MINLPSWLSEFAAQAQCPNCKEALNPHGVFGIGIREERVRKRDILALCFEYNCSYCSQKTVFTGFEVDFIVFKSYIEEIINDLPSKNKRPKLKHKKKSSITNKEIKDFTKILNSLSSHEEFLEKLGINTQDLKKYNNEDK